MIASLTGKVQSIDSNQVTFEVGGVGYDVICTQSLLAKLIEQERTQEKSFLLIFTDIKQDSIKLYGFSDRLEKQVFLLLLKVKGVGSRTACDIISRVDKKDLLRFVSQGDITQLQKIKGVGKKTAERIVVELKDIMLEQSKELQLENNTQVSGITGLSNNSHIDEAFQALMALGLQQRDAQVMLEQALKANPALQAANSSELIKCALQFI